MGFRPDWLAGPNVNEILRGLGLNRIRDLPRDETGCPFTATDCISMTLVPCRIDGAEATERDPGEKTSRLAQANFNHFAGGAMLNDSND